MKFIKRFDTLSAQTEYLNSADIDTYVGYVDENETVYYNNALPNYAEQYLTFVAEENNMSVGLSDAGNNVYQYSVDNGSTWNNLANDQSTSSVNSGEKIMFKASGLTSDFYNGIGTLKPSVNARVQGNIMSLLYGDNFANADTLTDTYTFGLLFAHSSELTSAENLILPATTLTEYCYVAMFGGCTNLTKAPELPATTLAEGCYQEMFYGCTSLTTAPELPATTLTQGCYASLFQYCTRLNYIKCLATNISADNCTGAWVDGVASTGTFVKAASMNDWTTGNNGIPANWTIENE